MNDHNFCSGPPIPGVPDTRCRSAEELERSGLGALLQSLGDRLRMA